MKIVVLDWQTVSVNGDISPAALEELGETVFYPLTSPGETVSHISDAEIALCNKVLITSEIMDACPKIRYIGVFATGYNNIDVEAAAERGITVCNAGEYSTNAVAQQTFAYILDRFSRIRDYDDAVRKGEWESSPTFSYFPIPTDEIAGKTLAVVGYGSIGRTVARIGAAFGMRVIVNTRTVPADCPFEVTDLSTAASQADVITFHCPLTEKTKGMVNSELLGMMKPSAVLINTSRGGVVCEADLAAALKNGVISAAYLDVLDKEPMSPDTPLKGIPGCTITPHTAWAPFETRSRLMNIVCGNIQAWLDGKPVNKVN